MYFILYRDRQNLWRWTLHAANNARIADSGESYYNKIDCLGAINLVKGTGAVTPVVER